jgi:hypothetical protein
MLIGHPGPRPHDVHIREVLLPLVKCGHCDSEHELGTKFCPQTGKVIGPPAKSNATMFMFRSPGSPLPGSSASGNGDPAPAAPGGTKPSAPTPPIGSSTNGGSGDGGSGNDTIVSPPPRTTTGTHKAVSTTGTHKAVSTTGTHRAVSTTGTTGTSDTLAATPAVTDSAIPVAVRTTGSRPAVGSGPQRHRTLTPSAPLKEVPRPPVAADLVPPPPVDPGLEGIVKNKITGEHSRTTGGSAARGSGPHRSRSVPSWVAAPEGAGMGSLSTGLFPAVNAPAKGVLALVREALTLYKRHAKILLTAAAVIYVPGTIITSLLRSQVSAGMSLDGGFFLVNALIMSLTMGVIHPLTSAVLTVAASDRLLGGNAGVKVYWGWLAPQTKPLLITLWMAAALLLVGSLLLVLPGLVLVFLFAFLPMVVLIEREAGVPALKRSALLVKKDWQRTLLLMLGFFVAMVAITWPVMLLPWPLLRAVVGIALGLAVIPLTALAVLLLYLDNRRAREGFDKEALQTQLDDLRNSGASNEA